MAKRTVFGFLVGIGALLFGALSGPVLAQVAVVPAQAGLAEAEGEVQMVELATNTIVINGVRFKVAPDVNVEIHGTYGAFSMLTPGMKVLYEYRIYAEDHLEVVDIEQLPDNTVIEET